MKSAVPVHEFRNLVLAILLSVGVLIGWRYVFEPAPVAVPTNPKDISASADASTPLPDATAEISPLDLEAQLAQSARIHITSDSLSGSINLQGARIDDLILDNYRQTVDKESDPVRLLAPVGSKQSYGSHFGWLSADNSVSVPDTNSQWQEDEAQLAPNAPVTLQWRSVEGLQFSQKITLDQPYLFVIEQTVTNPTAAAVKLFPYGVISRIYADENEHSYLLHEGPVGVVDQTLEEVSYESLREKKEINYGNSRGWMGISDKYWLTALIPDPNAAVDIRLRHITSPQGDRYQLDFTGEAVTVPAGGTATVKHYFYAGAKQLSVLDDYATRYQISLFDRAIDFGTLYFMTKPIFGALVYFNSHLGNFGLAIMLLTICIKLLLFPLANKSYVAMSQMKLLMPQIQQLKERYAGDTLKMNQEMMALYKREKVSPASGCLPILIQIPIFFALYKVLFVTIEMRHADFYGWVNDLSAPDPTSFFNLFGLLPFDPPGFLAIGAWPLIMCATMVIQQRLNPKPTDPIQASVMQWLPFIFLFLFAGFPAGLVIYWAWNNSLSILQQWLIMRRYRKKSPATAAS